MAWALWLSAPLVVTLVAAVGIWWRARPPRPQGMRESIESHREYLRVLGATVAGDHASDPAGDRVHG